MALNYPDTATSDDLSVPLLHQLETDSGKEKQEWDLEKGNSSNQTHNGRSDYGKEQTAAAAGKSSSGYYTVKPTLVSIGPKYASHFKGDAQEKNRKYKEEYFNCFLKRGREITTTSNNYKESAQKYYREHLEDPALELMVNARTYYEEIGIKCPSSDEDLVNMLLNDGGFVVEYIMRCKEGRINHKGKEALKDMLRFENQLPFKVLTALYDKMMGYPNEAISPPSFIRLVKFAFAYSAPNITPCNLSKDDKPENPLDILHVLHSLCLPIPQDDNKAAGSLCLPINPQKDNFNKEWPTVVHINSATELQAVGVRFHNSGKAYTMPRQYNSDTVSLLEGYEESNSNHNKTSSLFDITFSGGVMKIPSFKVDDLTEIFFRNMIALEQRRPLLDQNFKYKYYTDYARLMDHLVDVNKDVTLLRKNGVIHNLLGEDKKVANLFNNVSVEVPISPNFYFAPLYKKVNRHCRNRLLVWMAKLKADYFSNPWAGISSIAGAIVLLLGAALTLKTLLS